MRDGLSLCSFPGRGVGETDVPYFACRHKIVKCTHRLFDRGKPVPIMEPIQVEEELGRQNETISAHAVRSDEVANDLFGMTIGIGIRGIDEVASKVKVAGKNGL